VHDPRPDEADAGALLIVPLVILACGHMLSNMIRTLPAIAVDVMAPDLHSNAHDIASLTAAYHFAFALTQLPVGAALDRFAVRTVALALLAGTALGAVFAALAGGPLGFLTAQILLGIATSGMLMCPMTLAARRLSPAKFGFWSGLIISLGNMGMLLSASPLAWIVDGLGWRAGFWFAVILSCAIAVAVIAGVPTDRPDAKKTHALLAEMLGVIRLAVTPALRGIVTIAFVSIAVVFVLRGLWAGPWLMDIKGLSRVATGNTLFVFTLALIAGPFLYGALDRRLGHRRTLVATGHLLSAFVIVLMMFGAPGHALSRLFGVSQMPASYDGMLLVMLGFTISAQPLIFAMARQAVAIENTGKALAAVNLSLFLGTAVMQSATDPVAALWGLPSVLLFIAAELIIGVAIFLWWTRPVPTR
jgi:predicted MFS family arabinose efflux permease